VGADGQCKTGPYSGFPIYRMRAIPSSFMVLRFARSNLRATASPAGEKKKKIAQDAYKKKKKIKKQKQQKNCPPRDGPSAHTEPKKAARRALPNPRSPTAPNHTC